MFKLLGIDPGTNFCGVSIFTIESLDKIVDVRTELIDISNPIYTDLSNDLFYRLHRLEEAIKKLCLTEYPFMPIALGIEAGFINRFRPAAYGPLAKSSFIIEHAFKDITGSNLIVEYPPSIIKKRVSRQGLATKSDMLTAVLNNDELSPWLIGMETEHEIDAIAIGYCLLEDIRERPEILYKV